MLSLYISITLILLSRWIISLILLLLAAFVIVLVYAYMGDRNAGTESILDIYGGSKLHQHILEYYRTIDINDELHEMCYAFKENQ